MILVLYQSRWNPFITFRQSEISKVLTEYNKISYKFQKPIMQTM